MRERDAAAVPCLAAAGHESPALPVRKSAPVPAPEALTEGNRRRRNENTGGELSIAVEQGRQAIKAAAGDAVLYPSGAIHEVKPVESGARLVAVTWLQSLVRSAEKRRILFELGESIVALQAANVATAAVLLQLRATHDNLLRMWAEH